MSRDIGLNAETLAVQFLEKNGLTVLKRNFYSSWGEIDIIASDEETLCMVEVKMRSRDGLEDPHEVISKSKQRKLIKSALYYLSSQKIEDTMVRFDAVLITQDSGQTQIDWVQNAFEQNHFTY